MKPCESLVRRVLDGGGGEAMAALFLAVQDDVYGYLASELGRGADAEDAAQETFRRLIEGWNTLRDPGAFPGWLFGIARNVARESRRGHGVRRRLAEELAMRPERPGGSANDALEEAERSVLVKREVDALDEELRTTVRLRYERDLSYREIAQAMDCPEGTVSKRLHTAHERLRQGLAGAGLVVALSLLTQDLASAEKATVPPGLAARLKRLALELPATGVPVRRGMGARGVAWLATAAILLTFGGLGIRRLTMYAGQNQAASPGSQSGEGQGNGSESSGSGSRIPSTGSETALANPLSGSRKALAGRVVDSVDDSPVAQAHLVFTAEADRTVRETSTSASGEFEIVLPPGKHFVNARAEGFVALVEARLLEGAEPLTCTLDKEGPARMTVEMVRGSSIHGFVTTEQGATIPGAEIEFLHQDLLDRNGKPRSLQPFRAIVLTDAAGRFEFASVYPSGMVSFRARAKGRAVALGTAAPGGEVLFRLEPALSLPGKVQDEKGNGVASARFWLLPAETTVAEALEEAPDSKGEFSLIGVPANTRAIFVLAEGRGPALALPDPSGAPMNVVLPPADGTLEVTVKDVAGASLEKARVRVVAVGLEGAGPSLLVLRSQGGIGGGQARPADALVVDIAQPEPPGALTDALGHTTISGFAAGAGRTVTIRVDAEGFEPAWLRVSGDEPAVVSMTPKPAR